MVEEETLDGLIKAAYGPPATPRREAQWPPDVKAATRNSKALKRPAVTCMADVEPVDVTFLWDPFLPLGLSLIHI